MSRGWRIPAHAGQYSYEWLHQERREQLNTHFLTIRDLQGQLSIGERCVKLEDGDRLLTQAIVQMTLYCNTNTRI